MQSQKVKLLNNYQLYQLAHNKSLDKETLRKVHEEFTLRNISTIEQKQLEQRYQATFDKSNKELDANTWNPLYTAFAWKRHFKHIALLRSFERKEEAKTYEFRFYTGLAIYMFLFVLLTIFLAK